MPPHTFHSHQLTQLTVRKIRNLDGTPIPFRVFNSICPSLLARKPIFLAFHTSTLGLRRAVTAPNPKLRVVASGTDSAKFTVILGRLPNR